MKWKATWTVPLPLYTGPVPIVVSLILAIKALLFLFQAVNPSVRDKPRITALFAVEISKPLFKVYPRPKALSEN